MTIGGLLFAQKPMPKTTTERIAGVGTTKTETLRGTVAQVEGNTVVVKMSSGEIRSFTPPEGRRAIIDGQEVAARDLKPGTKLTATYTTTETPITERTTTVGSGKVWYVAGTNVILTLPNGENRQYKVKNDYKFMVDGKKATVFELRKGMVVSAEKIVETPHVEIASNTRVTGSAPPPPKAEVAQAAPAPAPAPAPVHRPAPKQVAKAEPAPAPEAEPAPMPTKLPKTGSPLPLIGLVGLGLGAASMLVRRSR